MTVLYIVQDLQALGGFENLIINKDFIVNLPKLHLSKILKNRIKIIKHSLYILRCLY